MGRRTSYAVGTPCWVDLATSDLDAAGRFYGAVLGWGTREVPEIEYTFFEQDGAAVAGLHAAVAGPPAWATYVCVDDVEATATRAVELGGSVMGPATDIPGHGRLAVIADPLGGVTLLWQPGAFAGAELVNTEGAWAWGDLQTADPEGTTPFYAALFGWEMAAVEGSHGRYWSISSAGRAIGGVMRAEQATQPFWAAYLAVADVDAALEAVVAGGGTKLLDPITVPSGRFTMATDPQGAIFGLIDGHFDD